jgi:hypothetical protein
MQLHVENALYGLFSSVLFPKPAILLPTHARRKLPFCYAPQVDCLLKTTPFPKANKIRMGIFMVTNGYNAVSNEAT